MKERAPMRRCAAEVCQLSRNNTANGAIIVVVPIWRQRLAWRENYGDRQRLTPAMQAGTTHELWTMDRLDDRLTAQAEPLRAPPDRRVFHALW